MNLDLLRLWSYQANTALIEALALFEPFFRTTEYVDRSKGTLIELHTSCFAASQAVLIMVREGRLWEAEMLNRSVFEGTCRFLWLCEGTPDARKDKTDEFLDVMPDLSRLRRHNRAEEYVRLFDSVADAQTLRPIRDLILPELELASLRSKYPRADRQRIEHRWSLVTIVRELSKTDLPGMDLLPAALHTYGMSSHYLHQDGVAVLVRKDREDRGPERKSAIEAAHAARLLNGVISFMLLRIFAAYRTEDLDATGVAAFFSEQKDGWMTTMRDAYDRWYEVEYGGGAG